MFLRKGLQINSKRAKVYPHFLVIKVKNKKANQINSSCLLSNKRTCSVVQFTVNILHKDEKNKDKNRVIPLA